MEEERFQAVILDCDGVLFDSTPANVAFYTAVLNTLGEPPLIPEVEERIHVFSSEQLFEELFGGNLERRAEASRVAASIDYQPFFSLMQPVESLHEILRNLRASYRLAMATNRGRTIPDLLREFSLEAAFDTVVGIQDVPRPKPHPDMLIECARRLELPPEVAVYVGDTNGDRDAAAAAGMSFIGVGDRCEHPVLIAHIRELEHMVAQMNDGRRRQR
jgi:HAD superfamily hydrolase (TIGR01509 family)